MTKAENSRRIAKIALHQDAYDAAVMNCVHSTINALDGLTTAFLGIRSSGEHIHSLDLIKGIFNEKDYSDIAKQFSSPNVSKNASEYQPDLMTKKEAESCVLRADRILAKVKNKLNERK